MKKKIKSIYKKFFKEKKLKFQRSLSFGDYFTDRWERANLEGFGEGTSVYDNVLILGKVKVCKNCWNPLAEPEFCIFSILLKRFSTASFNPSIAKS